MNQEFLDILHALSAHNAEFLVVGSFAVSLHSEPRATGDIDLFVNPSEANASKVYAALAEFGAPLQDLAENDLSTAGTIFQIGPPPYRIDILTMIDGVSFEEAARDLIAVDIEGLRVPFIGREALIKNKLASGRSKDLEDIKLLKKHADD